MDAAARGDVAGVKRALAGLDRRAVLDFSCCPLVSLEASRLALAALEARQTEAAAAVLAWMAAREQRLNAKYGAALLLLAGGGALGAVPADLARRAVGRMTPEDRAFALALLEPALPPPQQQRQAAGSAGGSAAGTSGPSAGGSAGGGAPGGAEAAAMAEAAAHLRHSGWLPALTPLQRAYEDAPKHMHYRAVRELLAAGLIGRLSAEWSAVAAAARQRRCDELLALAAGSFEPVLLAMARCRRSAHLRRSARPPSPQPPAPAPPARRPPPMCSLN